MPEQVPRLALLSRMQVERVFEAARAIQSVLESLRFPLGPDATMIIGLLPVATPIFDNVLRASPT